LTNGHNRTRLKEKTGHYGVKGIRVFVHYAMMKFVISAVIQYVLTTVRPCDTLSSVLLKHSVPQNSIPQD
jgi:hypothetical protein